MFILLITIINSILKYVRYRYHCVREITNELIILVQFVKSTVGISKFEITIIAPFKIICYFDVSHF